VPVVKDCKFDRDNVASATFDPAVAILNLSAQIKVPGRVCTRRIQNGGNIVFEDYRSEEANVDVASDLEDVFVLPVVLPSDPSL
jgi:hypothetical protein